MAYPTNGHVKSLAAFSFTGNNMATGAVTSEDSLPVCRRDFFVFEALRLRHVG